MRQLETINERFTMVLVSDEPDSDNVCHEYAINRVDAGVVPLGEFGRVNFQKGPIGECGVNGCHLEDLLAIVIDRLWSFQAGELSCRENAVALTHIEAALLWLEKRTKDRVKRGVEGTSDK